MSASYTIRGFQDILDLPTDEQVSTCIDEIKVAMLKVRAEVKRRNAALPPFEKVHVIWPEESEWVDDGRGEVEPTYIEHE